MSPRRVLRRGATLFAAAAFLVVGAVPAFAQYPGGGATPPVVEGEKFFRGPARTGSDILLFLVIALSLMLLGFALRRLTKRGLHREA